MPVFVNSDKQFIITAIPVRRRRIIAYIYFAFRDLLFINSLSSLSLSLVSLQDDGSRAAVTGIVEFAADGFRKRWWPNLQNDWSNTKEMDCIPLQDIIQQHYSSSAESSSNHHVHFDFLSLDVEGAEDQVLRSMDYTKVSFGVILLEADKHNERKNLAVRVFLEANGYTYLFHEQRSYWFVHRNFDQIYRHVLHA